MQASILTFEITADKSDVPSVTASAPENQETEIADSNSCIFAGIPGSCSVKNINVSTDQVSSSASNAAAGVSPAKVFSLVGTNSVDPLEGTSDPIIPDEDHDSEANSQSQIFILRGENNDACTAKLNHLSEYLDSASARGEHVALGDLAYTLAVRAQPDLPSAVAVCASNQQELARLAACSRPTTDSKHDLRIGFVFNGQGAQWYAMGRELIGTYPLFMDAVLEADRVLKGFGASWSLFGMDSPSWRTLAPCS